MVCVRFIFAAFHSINALFICPFAGRSADRGTDRRVQRGILAIRQRRRWHHHNKGVGHSYALPGPESHRGRAAGHDQRG